MFAVIYRFKVKQNREEEFRKNWETLTHEFRDSHGGLGSCLHRGDDGLFYAYARWPSRKLWKDQKEILNKEALAIMRDSVLESFPAIPLEIEVDLLVK